jgi:hypothetical protein
MRLYAAIGVDGQAMTVNFYEMSVENDVALDEFEVNFESLRVTGECGIQIIYRDVRQVIPQK